MTHTCGAAARVRSPTPRASIAGDSASTRCSLLAIQPFSTSASVGPGAEDLPHMRLGAAHGPVAVEDRCAVMRPGG